MSTDRASDLEIIEAFREDLEQSMNGIVALRVEDDLYAPWGGIFSEKKPASFAVKVIAEA